jgi:3-hydroxyisobutyrate dehydrogenase-like beta-hydroxyacid dehydrogenase
MGRGMAANLQKGGHVLVVNDLSCRVASPHLENGAIWAETPRVVAEACDLVFTSLPTPSDIETVGLGENGLAAGFHQGAAWFRPLD